MANFNERAFYLYSWEIFSRLSAKSILKLASTSKHSFNFIQNEEFCKEQDQNVRSMNYCDLFIQSNSFYTNNYIIELAHFGQNLGTGVQPHCMEFLRDYQILTSCGGLLLCRTPRAQYKLVEPFAIINPATGLIVKVPTPFGMSVNEIYRESLQILFNYSDKNNLTLIIMRLVSDNWESTYKCMIYCFKEREWMENGSNQLLDLGGRNLSTENQVFVDNCLYIMSSLSSSYTRESKYYFPYIVSYNLDSEETRFLRFPRRAHKGRQHYTCKMKIFSWNNWKTMGLVRLRKGLFTIWVLKDIKDDGSWIQILRKTLLDMRILEELTDFRVINGNKLVVTTIHNNVYSYNLLKDDLLKENSTTMVYEGEANFMSNLKVFPYFNTLKPIPNGMSIDLN